MAENIAASPAPRKRHGWLRVLAWIFGILIALVVVAYFIGTSAAFLKGVILPKVSQSLNAQITVSDASISPFSQVILKDLKVQTTGAEPLVTAPEVRLRYHLWAIIGGNMQVIGNAEIEFPIFDKVGIRGVVFTDVGNAFNLEKDQYCKHLRPPGVDPSKDPCLGPVEPLRLPRELGLRLPLVLAHRSAALRVGRSVPDLARRTTNRVRVHDR